MAPRDSPNEPTDEIVILPGEVGLVAFWRSKESWEVSVERGVEGGRGGNDGVRSPYLGSVNISPCPQPEILFVHADTGPGPTRNSNCDCRISSHFQPPLCSTPTLLGSAAHDRMLLHRHQQAFDQERQDGCLFPRSFAIVQWIPREGLRNIVGEVGCFAVR